MCPEDHLGETVTAKRKAALFRAPPRSDPERCEADATV